MHREVHQGVSDRLRLSLLHLSIRWGKLRLTVLTAYFFFIISDSNQHDDALHRDVLLSPDHRFL